MKAYRAFVAVLALLFLVGAFGFAEGQGEGQQAQGKPAPSNLTLWTTEEQPKRLEVQRNIGREFEDQTGVFVEVVPVTENRMGERVTAAFSAGDLPDLIYHPLSFTLRWFEAGILNSVAATDVVNNLGEETFRSGALNMIETSAGEFAAVPVDGWSQLLVYRKDLFEEHGLQAPTSYERIRTAIDELHNPPEMYGFVAATDPSQVYFMQVFEHIALANGVEIVDSDGNVTVNTPKLVETLEFYKDLAEASPEGNLYWQQSRELYLGGRAAMIVWSPFIMDELAGLRDSVPVTAFGDPKSDELARRTGFLTELSGPSNASGAGWMDMRYMGITVDASVNAAKEFTEYSMNEGYLDTLGIAPEGKFPVRSGTPENPQQFIEGWKELQFGVDRQAAPGEVYPDDVVNQMLQGLETGSRWGFKKGQGSLTSKLYETRVYAELVREYIDGQRSAEATAELMQQETEELLNQ